MHPRQTEILEKLNLAKDFQMADLRRSIFESKTNFLTALGLFSYTEFWGHFLTGTEAAGQSFDKFFRTLGPYYDQLLQSEPQLYDLIRCGLAHEYLPKKREFYVLGEDSDLTDDEIRQQRSHGLEVNQNKIEIVNSRYYLDLQDAVQSLIDQVPIYLQTPNSPLERRFNNVNFDNFH